MMKWISTRPIDYFCFRIGIYFAIKIKLLIWTHQKVTDPCNWNKGFDVYKKFDELLENEDLNNKFEFNFIGRLPEKFKFKNSNLIEPLSGKALANQIKNNH